MINFNVQIQSFPFDAGCQTQIEQWGNGDDKHYGLNWPVVYMLHNDDTKEAYVGETLNAGKRAAQHWQKEDKKSLKAIHIMTDDTFNKSVILDLESYLIKYVSADGRYKLQNGNTGLSDFDYYDRMDYEKQFEKIWEKLRELGLVEKEIATIKNTDEYKYSPYKTLTKDQEEVLGKLVRLITFCLSNGTEETVVVEGGAGTGKTILAVFLIKLLQDIKNNAYENNEENESDPGIDNLRETLMDRKLKIGFVVPQQSLRKTLKKVFSKVQGIPESIIMKPEEVVENAKDSPFDVLICDEAHRLCRRKSLSYYTPYDKANQELGLPKEATQLEWLIRCSKMQILFYDSSQSVKPSDIPKALFREILNAQDNRHTLRLTSQLRCLGGDDYIQYIHEMLYDQGYLAGNAQTGNKTLIMREGKASLIPNGRFKDYCLRFFDDIDVMMDEINKLDEKFGLCHAVAGYGWKWITEKEPKGTEKRDIDIGRGYIWNRTTTDWVNSKPLPYEIGCIHTIQGYDLNYVGVIFGPEIYYDPETNRIEVSKANYKDSHGREVGDDYEALRTYILNIYATLLTRGMHGAFVYVYDEALRNYLRPYFTEG